MAKKKEKTKWEKEVISDAKNPRHWTKPVLVKRSVPTVIPLNAEMKERIKIVARYHRVGNYQKLVKQWIKERLDTEYEIITNILSQQKKKRVAV